MRELYDPVYYPPTIHQGYESAYHQRHQHYLEHPPVSQYQSSQSVKSLSVKSSSSSSVLGRFLKLGKSKSDASSGGTSFGLSSSASVCGVPASSHLRTVQGGSEDVDDFRLSGSVVARGPVQKMVHKANSRKDVSRSHSWIYGSVKLPSDLPFGYADQFGADEGEEVSGAAQEMMEEGGAHLHPRSSHYLHTHGLHTMQIPRCHVDAMCTCDCGGGAQDPAEMMMMMSPSGRPIAGGSVRAGGVMRRKPPCEGCQRDMALRFAHAAPKRKSGAVNEESFVSSVKKLTWKSLKQVVKKRPSLDTLKKVPAPAPSEYLSTPVMPMPYLSPSAVAAATATSGGHDNHPQNPMANLNPQSQYLKPATITRMGGHHHSNTTLITASTAGAPQQPGELNYFFPEKKSFYASCNDIYDERQEASHVTASVRLRPKRTRQPWQFPESSQVASEMGPVPNYEEEADKSEMYHSEWDLRHVMSYDVWMNTTSNVKPRTTLAQNRVGVPPPSKSVTEERHYHSSGILHVPPPDYPSEPGTTFRPQQQKKSAGVDKIIHSSKSTNGSVKISKSSSSSSQGRTSVASLSSITSASKASSVSSDTLSISTFSNTPTDPKKKEQKSTAIVKRGSILAADVTAYQLLKAQTKKISPQKSVQNQNDAAPPRRPPPPQNVVNRQEIDDAFSESSDDLSDNAVGGAMSDKASSTGSTTTEQGKSRGGVRLAGQGIRISGAAAAGKNNSASRTAKSSVVPVKNVAVPRSSPRATTSTFTNYSPTSQNQTQRLITNSSASQDKPGKREVVGRHNSSSSSTLTSEDEVWSDCHTSSIRRTAKISPASVTPSISRPAPPGRGVSVPVSCPVVTTKEKSPHRVSTTDKPQEQRSRPTLVTFEVTKKQPEVPVRFTENDMEFEEYQVSDKQDDKLEQSKNVSFSESKNENVVSVTVSSAPSAQQSHTSYVKHSKGQQSSAVAATGKFGALRRRKSRSGSTGANTGKLLQETIYEEETEHVDDHVSGQNSRKSSTEHSVKIVVSQKGAPPTPAVIKDVKPILKNRERTYDIPVINPNASNNSQDVTRNMDTRETYSSSHLQQLNESLSKEQNQHEIYFDSSVSTASKKKVQFDQENEVMVCGGDSSGPDSYDENENDDSDEWSNKSEEEEEPLPTPPISHPQPINPAPLMCPLNSQLAPSPKEVSEGVDKPRARSSFEEEVARKAASFAKSREDAQKRKEAEQAEKAKEEETNKAEVEPVKVPFPKQELRQVNKPSDFRGAVVANIPATPTRNVKNVVTSPQQNSRKPVSTKSATVAPPAAVTKGGQKSTVIFDSGNGERIVNPNSLLFHDTTRIRLNQSRPALHENTFKLPNGGSPSKGGNNRLTRLKQSNSFRSVSSVPLRPKEPPPPPPVSSSGKGFASVPARLHKALSTSTLLSRSTEKLNSSVSLSTLKTTTTSASSHYGPGGRLLPSKSQISLPLGFTTTSKAAGLLAAGSVGSLTTQEAPPVITSSGRGAKGQLERKRNSTPNLAARSKSLTDRCEALEKVLQEQKKDKPLLPKHDIDSKNIEIVTKENSVSEIRIYSASASQLSLHPAENLPYQGILYDQATMTTPATSQISATRKTSEMHYAATDLFLPQHHQPPPKPPVPFSHPPLPPIPAEDKPETTGKSVVLIIDNSNKNKISSQKEMPLTNYSQPVDHLSKSQQLPLPTIPISAPVSDKQAITEANNDMFEEEPLYDDVINHSDNQAPLNLPPPSSFRNKLTTSRNSGGSISKSTGNVRNVTHQLGELPPLPPPPVPPHRTLPPSGAPPSSIISSTCSSGQVVSSTLPCPACPPSLPPPNLPSKNLSEFHNRPLVIQESEEDTLITHGFPGTHRSSAADEDDDVDNLYNDIGGVLSPPTKSSGAAAFASAMKEAFLGAIGNKSGSSTKSDSDTKSVHSVTTRSQLIYDDTMSVLSSSSGSSSATRAVSEVSQRVERKQTPLPLAPTPKPAISPKPSFIPPVEVEEEEEENEPLYDDVLNLTQNDKESVIIDQKNVTTKCGQSESGGSEYHSSNCSDSGTEDLPPPLPTQGPPPLPKSCGELSLITFPILGTQSAGDKNSENSAPTQGPDSGPPKTTAETPETKSNRTRSLLNELNEKLSKLNLPSPLETTSSSTNNSSTSPGSSSLSSSGTTSGEGQESDQFGTFHISKVVISPSSESSGVEEDYNSEKNYSLSNGSDASGGGSDNENYGKKRKNEEEPAKPTQDTISLARGKFLENMKLSMLSGGGIPSTASGSPGLLMIRRDGAAASTNLPEDPEEEPIYEEIGENSATPQKTKTPAPSISTTKSLAPLFTQDVDEDRSGSPLYADAFDAKSMFDGASRSEILSFLESIRDRLTGAESTSSSESKSSSIRSAATTPTTAVTTLGSVAINSGKCLDENGEAAQVEDKDASDMQMRETNTGGISCGGFLESQKKITSCPDCNDDFHLEQDEVGDPSVITGVANPPSIFQLTSQEDSDDKVGRLPLCRSCNRKRNEKREIIMEIYETEMKYGRDLRIVSEEFYKPIQVAGLLTKEQLDQIFLNVDQLSEINQQLTIRLKEAIQLAQVTTNDKEVEHKTTAEDVNVGKIFLELGEGMMTAFESYCTRQASAGALLSQLEKEKELLRIFLRVSQMENTVLRRMNLPAFLMVPVQRVTRYPLLLSRLLKVTPVDHFSREELQSAHEQIEQHLEHMNKTTREVASVKLWRRISMINGNSSGSTSNNSGGPAHRRSNSDLDTSNIRIRKMAMDVLDWANFNDVTCVIDNPLGSVHLNGKLMRSIYGCVLARGKELELLASKIQTQDPFFPPATEDVVKDVKLVLVRVKNTRFCLLREPLCLSKCVVSQGENEFQDFIEINEITTKNTYFIQGVDKMSTATWLKLLQCYSSCVGHWRRRRPALANIMMNGMIKHV